MSKLRWTLALALAALAAGCAYIPSIGPRYKRPVVESAPAYKELGDWKPTAPGDALARGPWWEIFNDEALNGLEKQINISNQNVLSAAAAVEQSRALLHEAEASFWPSITATGGRDRSVVASNPPKTVNSAGVGANWSIDIWGEIRRNVEASKASWQASEAALAAAQLSAQAELATDYFALRAQDQLQTLLNDTVAAQEQSLKITESRYKFGVAARADVVTAQTQLLGSQSQQVSAGIQRALIEHAIAVLVGQQPAAFALASAPMRTDIPTVPPGLPSELLERRPDVAQAERRVASANAEIGVAMTAFFPSLTITGSDDYTGGTLSRLFTVPNRVWGFGPQLAQSLFAGGLHRAQLAAARASYQMSVDDYRQTVLAGFQQVEDELATLRILEKQAVIEDQAVAAAREAEQLTLNQYKAGTVPYSSVIAAQTTTLQARETALNVLTSRFNASIALIEALGGGWDAQQLK